MDSSNAPNTRFELPSVDYSIGLGAMGCPRWHLILISCFGAPRFVSIHMDVGDSLKATRKT